MMITRIEGIEDNKYPPIDGHYLIYLGKVIQFILFHTNNKAHFIVHCLF